MSLRERLDRLLTSPRAPAFAAAIGAALSLPSLALGEFMDDHLLHERARLGDPAWAHMDTAARGSVEVLREHGMLGWWASEDFRLAFMRPLSGLSHALDYALWPEQVWLMHLENVALYALVILVVGQVFLGLFGPGRVTGLACLAFAIDELHAASVAWIAGRNTILAVLFGMLALLAHMRWRGADASTQRRWPFALAGPLCFALALASAEAGLAAFGYLLAWALTRDRGDWSSAAASLVPYLAIIVAWRVVFVTLGFGASGTTIYTDPADAPLAFVATASIRAPALAFTVLTLPLTDLMTALPWTVWPLAAGFVLVAWALAPLRDDVRARFLILAVLACTVPFAATSPSSRTMLILGPGCAGLFAMAWTRRRDAEFGGGLRRGVIGLIGACQLVIAPLAFVPLVASANLLDRPSRTLAEGIPDPEVHELVVVLNLPVEVSAFYPEAIRTNAGGRWPQTVYVLYAGAAPVAVTRVDDDSLELEVEGGWAAEHIDRFSRDWSRQGFSVGDRVALARATVEVLEVEPDGRPARIRVDFDASLDAVALVGLDGRELVPWQPALGERATFQAGI